MANDRDERLGKIISEFLKAAQQGQPADRDALLSQHPDLADDLRSFFANHDRMRADARAAAPEVAAMTETLALTPASDVSARPDLGNGAATVGDHVRYFGDYELLEEIARGGMGVVYKARQVNLNRIVALKMILAGQLATEEDVRRFRTEAEAAAKLDHPNIVPIFEVGDYKGQHYFSMGYVEGQSLADRLADGPLPPIEAAGLVKTITEAIQYAHTKGVIHRDLKPANVLLQVGSDGLSEPEAANANGTCVPRITDFGLAKKLEDDAGLTTTGQILGTPAYMPPEQATGKPGEVRETADVYSLGAILYCLLVGRPPFQAANVLETLQQVLGDEPAAPRQLNPAVPLDLETITLKCLQKDRRKRYGSARDLVDELDRFLRGEPIHARPVGRLERSWRWCRRNPVVAGLVALVALSLVIGTIVSTYFAVEAVQQAKVAVDQRDAARLAGERAENQRERAVEAERKTAAALADQRLTSYVHGIQLAHRAYLAGEFRRARELIDGCPEEHRHWEWRYLWRLLRSGRTVFEGHTAEVSDVAISPDGRLVVSVCATHLRGWDPETGAERFLVPGSGLGVTFSPEGDRIAVAGGQITIRDVKDRRELATFFHPKLQARCLAFDPQGKRIAGAGTRMAADGTARTEVGGPHGLPGGIVVVWDIATGKELHRFDKLSTQVFSVAFSPDGRLLAVATVGANSELPEPGKVQVWDLDDVKADPRVFRVHDKVTAAEDVPGMLSVAFAPDGSRLAAGCGDGKVYFWNTKDWKRTAIVSSREGSVRDIAFAADGKAIATVGSDRVVRILDTTKGNEVFSFRGHAYPHEAVALSRDGKHLVAVGGYRRNTLAGKPGWDTKGEAIAWHLDNRQGMRVIEGGSHFFPPDWRFVVTSSLGTASPAGNLTIHDLPSGKRRDFSPPHGYAARATLARDGKLIAASTHSGGANIWDVETGKLLVRIPDGPPLTGHNWYDRMLALSADGRRAATKFNGTLTLWKVNDPPKIDGVPTATVIRRFEPKSGQGMLYSVEIAFTPDGKSFLLHPYYSDDKRLRLISAETGEERFVSPGGSPVFTSDGRRFVLIERDQGFVVRSAEDGRILIRGGGEELRMGKLELAPNDRFIGGPTRAGGKSREGAIVWDLVEKAAVLSVEGHEVTSNFVFDDASRRFACGTFDGSLILGDVETGKTIVTRGHDDYVTVVAITHDGRRVVSTSPDGTVRIWDAVSGLELLKFVKPNPDSRYPIRSLEFDPRDHWLATQGPPLALWDGRPVE